MYLKTLKISSDIGEIREINFHKGINLIVDETSENSEETGNNVGKTTVISIIDFCLGGQANNIYTSPENKKKEFKLVKDFLIKNNILIKLILTESLDNQNSKIVSIERNFLSGKKKIQKINNFIKSDDEFEKELGSLLFKLEDKQKPSLRHILSRNLRYKDYNINNTINTLHAYAKDEEYEALNLFMLGYKFNNAKDKQELMKKISDEQKKKKSEAEQSKSQYESVLHILNEEITELNNRKSHFNLDQNFEKEFAEIEEIDYQRGIIKSEINKFTIRRDLIIESQKNLENKISHPDINQLKIIYQQAKMSLLNLQKTFEDLCEFHNTMLKEKVKYISQDLPDIEERINKGYDILKEYDNKKKDISNKITFSEPFEILENIISELNQKHEKKGEYENILKELNKVESNLITFNKDLDQINDLLFLPETENQIKEKMHEFNKFFTKVSSFLYGEKYFLNYEIKKKNGIKIYSFNISTYDDNSNISSGKKQGEIAAFDIAYIMFADSQKIPCLHFLLNDKKELMHDNQLIKIAQIVEENNIQFIAPILKKKLPPELDKDEYFVLTLSQDNKLFRIEELSNNNLKDKGFINIKKPLDKTRTPKPIQPPWLIQKKTRERKRATTNNNQTNKEKYRVMLNNKKKK